MEKKNDYDKKAVHMIELLKKRSSCRSYLEESLDNKELEVIIQAGEMAPIAMNRVNGIRIYVISEPSLLAKIEENTQKVYEKMRMKRAGIYKAPTLILVAVEKMEGPFEKAQYCSAACIIENMHLTATEMGFGSVFLTGVTTALNGAPLLMREIGLPDHFEAAAAMAVGKMAGMQKTRDISKNRFAVEYIDTCK